MKIDSQSDVHKLLNNINKYEFDNIKNIRMICDAICITQKALYIFMNNHLASSVIINFSKKYIEFDDDYIVYFIDILSHYSEICHIYIRRESIFNSHFEQLLLNCKNIQALTINNRCNMTDFSLNLGNVKHINYLCPFANIHNFFKLLENNSQIQSLFVLNNCSCELEEFLKSNEQNLFLWPLKTSSLQYVRLQSYVGVGFLNLERGKNEGLNKLKMVLETKRTIINDTIKTILLIANSKHKYRNYSPKPIMNMILKYIYDIDYMKNHSVIMKYAVTFEHIIV